MSKQTTCFSDNKIKKKYIYIYFSKEIQLWSFKLKGFLRLL